VVTTVPLVVGLGALLPGIRWLSVAWLASWPGNVVGQAARSSPDPEPGRFQGDRVGRVGHEGPAGSAVDQVRLDRRGRPQREFVVQKALDERRVTAQSRAATTSPHRRRIHARNHGA